MSKQINNLVEKYKEYDEQAIFYIKIPKVHEINFTKNSKINRYKIIEKRSIYQSLG